MAFEIRYNDQPIAHGMHTHTYDEMLYVLDGSAEITVRSRVFTCGPGTLIFLNPFDEHASRPVALPYRRYYLLIPQTQLKAFHNDVLLLSVFRCHGEQFPYILDTGEKKPLFDAYFEHLLQIQKEGGDYLEPRMEAMMTLILTDAQALRPDLFTPANQLSFLPIQDIMSQLDAHFTEPFSLTELARRFHVSPGCLSAHFRRAVGVSPMQYVVSSRMQRAKLLLSHSELPVAGIAQQCGYPDPSNFVRRFRQQYGLTPLQYRRQSSERPGHEVLSSIG